MYIYRLNYLFYMVGRGGYMSGHSVAKWNQIRILCGSFSSLALFFFLGGGLSFIRHLVKLSELTHTGRGGKERRRRKNGHFGNMRCTCVSSCHSYYHIVCLARAIYPIPRLGSIKARPLIAAPCLFIFDDVCAEQQQLDNTREKEKRKKIHFQKMESSNVV